MIVSLALVQPPKSPLSLVCQGPPSNIMCHWTSQVYVLPSQKGWMSYSIAGYKQAVGIGTTAHVVKHGGPL